MEKLGVRRDSTRQVFRTPELRYADLGGGYVNLHVLRHIELCIKKIVLLYVKKHNLKNNVRRRRGKGSVCTALEANVSCSRLAGRGHGSLALGGSGLRTQPGTCVYPEGRGDYGRAPELGEVG